MPGTINGGKSAAETNKERYGEDFYKNIGRKGGLKSRGGGFAANPKLAVEAGRKGGAKSRVDWTEERRLQHSLRMRGNNNAQRGNNHYAHKSWRERVGL